MLWNLKIEILRHKTSQRKIAAFLGIDASQFCRKVNEKANFTRDEMYKIHDEFFREADMYQLFKSDGAV